MIKLVAFDWNGTLLADVSAVVDGVNARMRYLGFPSINTNKLREIYEIPVIRIYEKLGLDTETIKGREKEMSELFHTEYEKKVLKARTRSGTREVLTFLKDKNIPAIIISNHTLSGIESQLLRLKLDSYFKTILANENNWRAHSHGKKDMLIDYLSELDLKPSEVLIIGDSTEEISIAKDLGLHTVAISGGHTSTKRLKAAKPDVLIHKLHDLIEVIKEIK